MSTAAIARRPASIADTDAAAVPVAGVTALTMVETGPLRATRDLEKLVGMMLFVRLGAIRVLSSGRP